jgi:hypothetical protein
MSHYTNRYGVTKHTTSPDIKNQPAPRRRHKPNPTASIEHHSKLRSIIRPDQETTAHRTSMAPPSMIRQPNPKERGLNKKSVNKLKGSGSAMRLLPISPHWTVIEGRIEVRSFITTRDEKWKRRGFTDPVARKTLNVHDNKETYFCGFPGEGSRAKSNVKIKIKQPTTKIIKACMRSNWEEVTSLLNETPLRAEQRTENNCYPLHLCLMRNAPENVISHLIELYPEAAKQATKKRRALPLHLACESNQTIGRIVLMVADAYHGAAKKRMKPKYEWALPLHRALSRGLAAVEGLNDDRSSITNHSKHMTTEDWGAVLAILKVYPDASKKKYRAKLPLEWAAQMNAPLGVLQALFDASRSKSILEALRGHVWGRCIKILSNKTTGPQRAKGERTEMNQFPLHVAVQEGAPVQVVRMLLELYPKAAGRRAKFSFWVLGTKTRKGRWRSPVSTLVGHKELLYHDHMPIHTAAAVSAPKDVIDALAEYNPQSFETRARGLLPLHIAIQNHAAKETVQALLHHNSKAAFLRTDTSLKNIRLPLHLAMIHNAPVDVVSLLMNAYPGAVDEVDAWGHRPVHYGLSSHSSLDVVRNLLKNDGHHADDSMRNVAIEVLAKERMKTSSATAEGGKLMLPPVQLNNQHEHQYWNKPWNYQELMMKEKRWGEKRKKAEIHVVDEKDAPEESESESDTSSSSGSDSSSGSGSSDEDDSEFNSSDSDDE